MKLIVTPRRFLLGLGGLAGFALVFGAWFWPDATGRMKIEWADDLFNRLTKDSAYYIPGLERESAAFRERALNLTLTAGSPEEAAKLAKLAAWLGMKCCRRRSLPLGVWLQTHLDQRHKRLIRTIPSPG